MKYIVLAALLAIGPASYDACAATGRECCKVCKAGKACGDSCIAADRKCSQPPGCACNG